MRINFKEEIKKMSIRESCESCESCGSCLMSKIYHEKKVPPQEIIETLSDDYDFCSCLPYYLYILLSVFSKEKAIEIFKRTIKNGSPGFPCINAMHIFKYVAKSFNGLELE